MSIDLPTLMVAGSFVAAVSGVFLVFAWFQNRKAIATLWWAASNLVLAISVPMMARIMPATESATTIFAITMLNVNPALIWASARACNNRPINFAVVISGAFSITHQAMQLGFIPRLSTRHTSEHEVGQIYIPFVNWALMWGVIVLVLIFQNSSNLASAYGIAVTGAMLIDTCLMTVLLVVLWEWKPYLAIPVVVVFFLVDGTYFAANATKVTDGGWFPLLIGGIAFTLLTTWNKGRRLMRDRMTEAALPLNVFAKSAHGSAARVPGTAIFMASTNVGVPSALLHNIKHNKVLHERVVVLTVEVQDVPWVEPTERFSVASLGEGFYRLTLRYGFMEETDVPAALAHTDICGGSFEMMKTSFFLSRQTLLPSAKPGIAIWREKLFAWMMRNAASAMEFFRLPTNRVVELGSQLEI